MGLALQSHGSERYPVTDQVLPPSEVFRWEEFVGTTELGDLAHVFEGGQTGMAFSNRLWLV
jgi:hypothetical protein